MDFIWIGWGEFLHKPGVKFTDDNEIRREIENDTIKVAGNNKEICSKPINLKMYSNISVHLTLVDLPGITKVPLPGQPEDIGKQTKQMVIEHAKNPDSIILAVQAANVDLANSEAIKIAKELDPTGRRTLAVLTKLDLMDEGTDASDILNGSVIPLKLGIIGVVNRSQKDINDNKGVMDQMKKEVEFFKLKYPDFVDRNGTNFLIKRMNQLLVKHIHKCMPKLKEQVKNKLLKTNQKLILTEKQLLTKRRFQN